MHSNCLNRLVAQMDSIKRGRNSHSPITSHSHSISIVESKRKLFECQQQIVFSARIQNSIASIVCHRRNAQSFIVWCSLGPSYDHSKSNCWHTCGGGAEICDPFNTNRSMSAFVCSERMSGLVSSRCLVYSTRWARHLSEQGTCAKNRIENTRSIIRSQNEKEKMVWNVPVQRSVVCWYFGDSSWCQ